MEMRNSGSSSILRLGVLGLSEGNGHPYSWSAIFNGYDAKQMADCPFPVIPKYLACQEFPRDSIPGAKVTHVWAQDLGAAGHIAAAASIPVVVRRYEEMIGEVDAVLLARDDAENHLQMSIPFLDAGLPIYIDKPITLSLRDLAQLYSHEKYPGQIFSCSALRFAREFQPDQLVSFPRSEIRHVQATTPKDWRRYGVHIIEPVLQLLGRNGLECEVSTRRLGDVQISTADWGVVSASFTCLGSSAGEIRVTAYGPAEPQDLVFKDTFFAFKASLEAFVHGIRSSQNITPRKELEGLVSIIERGIGAQ